MTAVAHVSYIGGGIFLRDHGPGDRQTIIDYVGRLVRSKAKVQILLESQRWLIQAGEHVRCTHCTVASNVGCREASRETDAFCLHCALTGPVARPAVRSQPARQHLTLALARN